MVGEPDGAHGDEFGGSALGVGEMFLADFFTDGDDDAFPADHGAQAKRKRDGELDPGGDVLGGELEFLLIVGKRLALGAIGDLLVFEEFVDGGVEEIEIFAGGFDFVGGELAERILAREIGANLGVYRGKRSVDAGGEGPIGLEVIGDDVGGITGGGGGAGGLRFEPWARG